MAGRQPAGPRVASHPERNVTPPRGASLPESDCGAVSHHRQVPVFVTSSSHARGDEFEGKGGCGRMQGEQGCFQAE